MKQIDFLAIESLAADTAPYPLKDELLTILRREIFERAELLAFVKRVYDDPMSAPDLSYTNLLEIPKTERRVLITKLVHELGPTDE